MNANRKLKWEVVDGRSSAYSYVMGHYDVFRTSFNRFVSSYQNERITKCLGVTRTVAGAKALAQKHSREHLKSYYTLETLKGIE